MSDYLLTWQIDIEADSPEEAVKEAIAIQKDPVSTATIFDVYDKELYKMQIIDGDGLNGITNKRK